jgi:hypothetical protein
LRRYLENGGEDAFVREWVWVSFDYYTYYPRLG